MARWKKKKKIEEKRKREGKRVERKDTTEVDKRAGKQRKGQK